jgi:hypothetical protein
MGRRRKFIHAVEDTVSNDPGVLYKNRIQHLVIRYEPGYSWSCYYPGGDIVKLVKPYLDKLVYLRGPIRDVQVQYYVPEIREAYVYQSRPDWLAKLKELYPHENS